jgi:CRP-like cAMP-binding protein
MTTIENSVAMAGQVLSMASQTLDEDVEVLRTIPFFSGFSEEHLKLIASSSESRTLPDKLLLYDEGQLLHSAYVIMTGTLKSEHKVKGTGKTMRRDIDAGVILGERALILDTRASESVRVETRARVLQIRKLTFRKLLQDNPEIARILRSRMARHVLQVAEDVRHIGERLKAIDG